MENIYQGLTVPKWVLISDKSAKNTPNAPNIFGPICLPEPKSLGFLKKSSLQVSLVRAPQHCRKKGHFEKEGIQSHENKIYGLLLTITTTLLTSTIFFGHTNFRYRTRTIITRSSYIFYPIYEVHFSVFKEFFSENSVLLYGQCSRTVCNQERVV